MTKPMETTTRRGLILAAASGVAAAASPALATPSSLSLADLKKEGDVACIYHCDFGEPPRFQQMLNNISNHYSVYESDPFALQLAIVAHSAGIKFFLNDLDDTPWREEAAVLKIFDRVADVAKNGLRVYLCEITFNRLKIDKGKTRSAPFLSFVPSGVATVAALQAKGFGYMKTG